MNEPIAASCNCCESQVVVNPEVMASMKLPAVWCRRCYDTVPFLILRKIFVLNLLWQKVWALEQHLGVQ